MVEQVELDGGVVADSQDVDPEVQRVLDNAVSDTLIVMATTQAALLNTLISFTGANEEIRDW